MEGTGGAGKGERRHQAYAQLIPGLRHDAKYTIELGTSPFAPNRVRAANSTHLRHRPGKEQIPCRVAEIGGWGLDASGVQR